MAVYQTDTAIDCFAQHSLLYVWLLIGSGRKIGATPVKIAIGLQYSSSPVRMYCTTPSVGVGVSGGVSVRMDKIFMFYVKVF